jgi:endo-1,4-beta-xylanase
MTHCRGKFAHVGVVNELLSLLGAPGQTSVPLAGFVFDRLLCKEYIRIAFEAARAADPDALLFINEILVEESGAQAD